MKFGLVTDTHAGVRSDERVQDTLHYLANEFKSRNVDAVVHLGDVAHEKPTESYIDRVKQVLSAFNHFKTYATLGNHDIQAVTVDEFESAVSGSCNQILHQTEETAVIKINTAAQVSLPGIAQDHAVGCLTDTAQDLILTELREGKTVTVLTHYSIQFTEYYQKQDFFNVRPEYTFPVNKPQFERELISALEHGSLELYCGHLHPTETTTVNTRPFDIPLTIMEPVQHFTQENEEIIWSDNLHPTVEDLILEV